MSVVRPGHDTNPLAEKTLEALQRALETASNANEALRDANEALRDAVALIAEMQTRLDNAREESLAYFLGSMEEDAQIVALERLWARETPKKNV